MYTHAYGAFQGGGGGVCGDGGADAIFAWVIAMPWVIAAVRGHSGPSADGLAFPTKTKTF